jgi:Chaperone of endosialidase
MINFPDAPSYGDAYSAGNSSWTWDGIKWVASNSIGGPFLPLVGGTMEGAIVLPGDPGAALEAAPKQYVDTRAGLYVPLTGATMTGPLLLSTDPGANLGAATKQYVDSRTAAAVAAAPYLPLAGGTLSGWLKVGGGAPTTLGAGTIFTGSGYLVSGPTVAAYLTNSYFDGSSYRAINAGGVGLLQYNGSAGAAYWNFYSNAGAAAGAAFTPTQVLRIDQTGCLTFNQFQMSGNKFNFNWTGGALQAAVNASTIGNLVKSIAVGGGFNMSLDTVSANSSTGGCAMWQGGTGFSWNSTVSSDRRLKSNLVKSSMDALAAVNALPVYECDMTQPMPDAEPQHWDWALIADEVEQVLPLGVTQPNEHFPYASMREYPFIPMLIKAVQELTARIAVLEAEAL